MAQPGADARTNAMRQAMAFSARQYRDQRDSGDRGGTPSGSGHEASLTRHDGITEDLKESVLDLPSEDQATDDVDESPERTQSAQNVIASELKKEQQERERQAEMRRVQQQLIGPEPDIQIVSGSRTASPGRQKESQPSPNPDLEHALQLRQAYDAEYRAQLELQQRQRAVEAQSAADDEMRPLGLRELLIDNVWKEKKFALLLVYWNVASSPNKITTYKLYSLATILSILLTVLGIVIIVIVYALVGFAAFQGTVTVLKGIIK